MCIISTGVVLILFGVGTVFNYLFSLFNTSHTRNSSTISIIGDSVYIIIFIYLIMYGLSIYFIFEYFTIKLEKILTFPDIPNSTFKKLLKYHRSLEMIHDVIRLPFSAYICHQIFIVIHGLSNFAVTQSWQDTKPVFTVIYAFAILLLLIIIPDIPQQMVSFPIYLNRLIIKHIYMH